MTADAITTTHPLIYLTFHILTYYPIGQVWTLSPSTSTKSSSASVSSRRQRQKQLWKSPEIKYLIYYCNLIHAVGQHYPSKFPLIATKAAPLTLYILLPSLIYFYYALYKDLGSSGDGSSAVGSSRRRGTTTANNNNPKRIIPILGVLVHVAWIAFANKMEYGHIPESHDDLVALLDNDEGWKRQHLINDIVQCCIVWFIYDQRTTTTPGEEDASTTGGKKLDLNQKDE